MAATAAPCSDVCRDLHSIARLGSGHGMPRLTAPLPSSVHSSADPGLATVETTATKATTPIMMRERRLLAASTAARVMMLRLAASATMPRMMRRTSWTVSTCCSPATMTATMTTMARGGLVRSAARRGPRRNPATRAWRLPAGGGWRRAATGVQGSWTVSACRNRRLWRCGCSGRGDVWLLSCHLTVKAASPSTLVEAP